MDSGFGSGVQKSQEKLSMYFISVGDRIQKVWREKKKVWSQKDSYRSLFYHSHFAKTEKQSEAQEEMTTYGLQSYPYAELLTVCMIFACCF